MNNENNYPRVEIRTKDEYSPVFTEVLIDGHLLRGVRSYKLEHSPNTIPKLTLELHALNIAVDQPMVLFAPGFGEMEINFKKPSEDGLVD